MAKKSKNELLAEAKKEAVELIAQQLEQVLAATVVNQFRLEFLAYKVLPKEKYLEICKNVADFSKKVCTSQEKVVSLLPEEEKPSPTPEV